jgi:hypothetical protein
MDVILGDSQGEAAVCHPIPGRQTVAWFYLGVFDGIAI